MNADVAEIIAEEESELGSTPRMKRTGTGMVVVEPKDVSFELRKASEALTIRNISATEITFLVRKAYNVMLQLGQQARSKSKDKDQITFECSIKDFEKRVGHSTPNSREHLKNVLRQLTSFQVEFDYKGPGKSKKGTWGVASMVAEVNIHEETNMLEWSFPPMLAQKMLDPEIYNAFNIDMQNQFSSHSALALYEIVSRYFSSPQKRTFAEHWTVWSVLLSGSKEPHKTFRDFNKMLSRALEQVKEKVKTYDIILYISKQDRKYDRIWFEIKEQEDTSQEQLALIEDNSIGSEELRQKLFSYGLKEAETVDLLIRFEEEYLLAQADFLDKRINKKGAEKITSPRAYFMKAIEENYADAPRRPVGAPSAAQNQPKARIGHTPPKESVQDRMEMIKESWKAMKMDEIRTTFRAQTEEKRSEIMNDIEPELVKNTIMWTRYRKNGLTAAVEQEVIELIFRKNVPPPTHEELFSFAIEKSGL